MPENATEFATKLFQGMYMGEASDVARFRLRAHLQDLLAGSKAKLKPTEVKDGSCRAEGLSSAGPRHVHLGAIRIKSECASAHCAFLRTGRWHPPGVGGSRPHRAPLPGRPARARSRDDGTPMACERPLNTLKELQMQAYARTPAPLRPLLKPGAGFPPNKEQ